MNRSTGVTLNVLGLYGIALILVAAFAAQILLNELPCPLCLLQRVLFSMLAIGPILNIRFGPRPSHYALSLLAAIVGAAFSMRQILLHILPGDAGYGTALLGYHYYSLALIGFAAAIACWRRSCCSTASSKRTTQRHTLRPARSRRQRCGW